MKKFLNFVPALCFIVGFAVGALFLISNVGMPVDSSSYFSEIGHISFLEIFLNNTLMCLLFLLGCGVISSIMIFAQGFSFGFTFFIWIMMGNAAKDFWLLFLPHVTFEFVAMTLAGCMGFKILHFLINKNKQSLNSLLAQNKNLLIGTFLSVFIAAIIECYITPLIYTIF